MKRSPPPRRKTPLKRGAPPKRKTKLGRSALVRRVVQKIRTKGKPRFKRGRDPAYLEWIRGLLCQMHYRHVCIGPIQAAHVKSRGAGGADVGNTIPLCESEHRYQHQVGIKTWALHWYVGGLDEVRKIAAQYVKQFEKAKTLGWEPATE